MNQRFFHIIVNDNNFFNDINQDFPDLGGNYNSIKFQFIPKKNINIFITKNG